MTAADFMPNTRPPHLGLDLVNNKELLVDVTGDELPVDEKLIVDLNFTPPPIPEPALLLLPGPGSRRVQRFTPSDANRSPETDGIAHG
jgi:hypothetical protein